MRRFAAIVPAMIAVWKTGPLALAMSPSLIAARTGSGNLTSALACAVLDVTALPLTSTIVG